MEMSQQRLAEVSGVAQQTISKIENGESTNPGIETLYRLAIGLGCTLWDIYRPDGPGIDLQQPAKVQAKQAGTKLAGR